MIAWYNNLKIRWRLSVLVVSVAVYTAVTISLAVYYLWTEQIRHQVSAQLQQQTELATTAINQQLRYETNNLQAWAQLDVMNDIITGDIDKRIINTLKLLKKNYNLAGDLILVDKQFAIIASTDLNITRIEKSIGKFSLIGDLNNQATLETKAAIKLPILPNKISGYLILTHPWDDLRKQLSKSLNEFIVVKDAKAFHYNKLGLASSVNTSQINVKNIDWNLGSQDKLHTSAIKLLNLTNSPVSLFGIVNKNSAFQLINDTLYLIGMVGLLLLIPILIISMWSANRFLNPIIELQRVAEKITESGDLNIVIPVKNKDEIGRLATILNKMTASLKSSFEQNEQSNRELQILTENLEQRVDERTQELSSTLAKLKSAQSQLVQSEKMSSLGQLVAGIAHELNNPISSVHVNTPMLRDYVDDLIEVVEFIADKQTDKVFADKLQSIDYDFLKEDIISLLDAQQDAAKRIRDIVLSLRTFSRLDESEIKSVDLNENIDNTINILRHEIKHRIEIHKDYQLTQPAECFPGEINQVILNILANAAQAIPGQGNIYISTAIKDHSMAEISISDDGAGLPQGVIDKIFDPFFTTKEVGVGTGLGLSISYGIIEKHHGCITAENIAPHGAKFTLQIPLKQRENA